MKVKSMTHHSTLIGANTVMVELKSLLMRVKEKSEKGDLKLNIQKLRSGHLVPTLNANRMGKSGTSDRFYFLGFQNLCGQWLKSWNYKTLTPWKESYDKPRQCVKKAETWFHRQRSIESKFFQCHVWVWELDHKEGWALKNWCFQIVVLENTLESSLDYKEMKPINPKGNHSEYSLEGLMLKVKLKLQEFGHLMQRADPLEKTLMLGKIEGRRRRGQQRMRWLGSITDSKDINLSKLWEIVKDRGAGMLQSMGSQIVRHDLATEQQQQQYGNIHKGTATTTHHLP